MRTDTYLCEETDRETKTSGTITRIKYTTTRIIQYCMWMVDELEKQRGGENNNRTTNSKYTCLQNNKSQIHKPRHIQLEPNVPSHSLIFLSCNPHDSLN